MFQTTCQILVEKINVKDTGRSVGKERNIPKEPHTFPTDGKANIFLHSFINPIISNLKNLQLYDPFSFQDVTKVLGSLYSLSVIFFFNIKKNLFDIQMVYNVVLIFAVQQSDSVIYIYTFFFKYAFLLWFIGYGIQFSVLHSRTLWLSILYIIAYV